jgi:hypothetical protein
VKYTLRVVVEVPVEVSEEYSVDSLGYVESRLVCRQEGRARTSVEVARRHETSPLVAAVQKLLAPGHTEWTNLEEGD